jgi:thiol:disulfide interchange protein DsbD
MEYKQERRIEQILATRGNYELKRITDENAEIPWNPFTPAMLTDLLAKNEPVLIDFTADWCGTCKWLEKNVLNTQEVRAALKSGGVVAVQADMTEESPDAQAALADLRSNGIPVVAIYPRGSARPSQIFRGAFTQAQLLDALKEAEAKGAPSERTASLSQ